MRLAHVAVVVLGACAAPRPPAIELVETPPVETTLDSELADTHGVWLQMVNGATSSIELGQFYASNAPQSRLEPIVVALERAAKRGVQVHFLAEKSFVATYPDTLDRLAHAGATVRQLDLATGGILHAKYMIVDRREAFIGSQNFDYRALEHNLELGARVRDAGIVDALVTIFVTDWAFAGGETAPARATKPSQLVASPRDRLPPGVAWDLPALAALIDSARTTIHVQLLTYRADFPELEAALVRAAQRGVAVELLVADWAKRAKTLPGLQQLARTPGIAISFVTLPAWSGGFIPYARVAHAKLIVVDGARGWLGTSNWEREYFYESRNVGILTDDAALARQLERFFAATRRYAYRVDPEASYEPPRIGE